MLKKREHIILAVRRRGNARYVKRTHKFGIEVPRTVEKAYEIDKKNGNTLWTDAIAKEAKSVRSEVQGAPRG